MVCEESLIRFRSRGFWRCWRRPRKSCSGFERRLRIIARVRKRCGEAELRRLQRDLARPQVTIRESSSGTGF